VEKHHAKDEHVVQVNIYMWVLGLQSAVVLYENKNTQELHEEYVPRDENLIEQIKKDAIEMQEILACEKLPNRFPGASKSKYPCRGCEFLPQCFP
jgi:CRISPR/Cas system-associated exonuclease Cas4 (RecB family)